MAASDDVGVIVTVDDDGMTRLADVLDKLRVAGLRDGTILPGVGIIVGTVSHEDKNDLARVPGVRAVEEDRRIDLT